MKNKKERQKKVRPRILMLPPFLAARVTQQIIGRWQPFKGLKQTFTVSRRVAQLDFHSEQRIVSTVEDSVMCRRWLTSSLSERIPQRGSCGIRLWVFSGWLDLITRMRSGLLVSDSPSLSLVSVHIPVLSDLPLLRGWVCNSTSNHKSDMFSLSPYFHEYLP